jgi:hypothetical protein
VQPEKDDFSFNSAAEVRSSSSSATYRGDRGDSGDDRGKGARLDVVGVVGGALAAKEGGAAASAGATHAAHSLSAEATEEEQGQRKWMLPQSRRAMQAARVQAAFSRKDQWGYPATRQGHGGRDGAASRSPSPPPSFAGERHAMYVPAWHA